MQKASLLRFVLQDEVFCRDVVNRTEREGERRTNETDHVVWHTEIRRRQRHEQNFREHDKLTGTARPSRVLFGRFQENSVFEVVRDSEVRGEVREGAGRQVAC